MKRGQIRCGEKARRMSPRSFRVFLKESTKEIREGRQVIKSCLLQKDRKGDGGNQDPTNEQDFLMWLFTSPQSRSLASFDIEFPRTSGSPACPMLTSAGPACPD